MLPPPVELRTTNPAVPSWAASLLALATAIGGVVTAWQTHQSGQDTLRAAYAALERADGQKSAQLAELAQQQLELRAWVTELSDRLDQRTTQTERAIRKVVKPKTALPPPVPPPAPPPAAEVTPSTPLPSFEELGRSAPPE